MADGEETPRVTDKPRKRKIEGRKNEKIKNQKLAGHITGPDCFCARLKCFEIVNVQNRTRLIDAFNALPTKDAQDSYLATLITVTEITRHRPRKDEPKSSNNNSYYYKVFIKGSDEGPDSFAQVCFTAFLSFFGIKKGRLETIKKSLATTGAPPKDQRGQHSNRPHKISDDLMTKVRGHISSFRGRQSHYSVERTRRLYLPEELNITKMFNMFQESFSDVQISYETYRCIFNRDFNIGFGYPRTDTCSKCDEFKIKISNLKLELQVSNTKEQELRSLETEKDLHQRKANTFYRRKREARLRAKSTPSFQAFTFDYQKNLNVPNQSTNDFYYHRKLTFNSFNIHKLSTNDVYIYCYDETVANKGSDEVTSMLFDHFINNVSDAVRHLELFCDSCAGQNKNYTMIRFLDYLVHHKKRFDSIKISFPERGHSYMECDRDMGLIDCKSSVSVPADWVEIFRSARQNPSPYNVIEVTQSMIKGFGGFLRPFYKKGCAIPTRQLRELFFKKEFQPGVFAHRDSWNGLFLKSNINCAGRQTTTVITGEPQQLYKGRLTISTAKYKDLQLLKKFSSNPDFFTSLPYDDKPTSQDEEVK